MGKRHLDMDSDLSKRFNDETHHDETHNPRIKESPPPLSPFFFHLKDVSEGCFVSLFGQVEVIKRALSIPPLLLILSSLSMLERISLCCTSSSGAPSPLFQVIIVKIDVLFVLNAEVIVEL